MKGVGRLIYLSIIFKKKNFKKAAQGIRKKIMNPSDPNSCEIS